MKKNNFPILSNLYLLPFIIAISLCFINCQNETDEITSLPFLGKPQVQQIVTDGIVIDTLLPHRIPDFEITNQYGTPFGAKDLTGKVHLTEFFFTSCPSVCPKVAKQMKAIHQQFAEESNFALVSFTLDTKYDTPDRLFEYAQKKEVNQSNWYFLNGEKETIYDLAEQGYYVAAYQDSTRKEDNIMHDGVLVLVDKKGHIRGMYDGKEADIIPRVKQAIKDLLIEEG